MATAGGGRGQVGHHRGRQSVGDRGGTEVLRVELEAERDGIVVRDGVVSRV